MRQRVLQRSVGELQHAKSLSATDHQHRNIEAPDLLQADRRKRIA
jgi:hypothetical protein